MTKGSPGSCHHHHPRATVAEIEQEANWQGNSVQQNKINVLFHKPSVTQSPNGISRGLGNPFCPHGITNRDCGIGKTLHLAIIILKQMKKITKSQQRNRSKEKNQMELKHWKRQKKKRKGIKTLLNGLNIGMENTEKRFSKPQGTELEFTQIENHTHTHTHKRTGPQRPGRQ